MNIEERFYTYCYYDPSRGMEPIYVGKGTGDRAKSHLSRKDHHPLTYRLRKMKSNGVEPIIKFLCNNVDEELAILCEEEAISKYGRRDLGKGTLLNLTDGGEGTSGFIPTFTEEHKRKISLARSGQKLKPQSEETKNKRADKLRGTKRTVEQRNNISASKKGKRLSEAHKQALKDAKRNKREQAAVNRLDTTH